MLFFTDGIHHARHWGLLTGTSSFRSRSPTPEGPGKKPREDSEVAVEETADTEFIGEPPAPERAAEDSGEMVVARPGQAPETLSAAPAAHMPRATDTSGMLLLSFDSEGCASSCHVVDGFLFYQGAPGRETTWIPRS